MIIDELVVAHSQKSCRVPRLPYFESNTAFEMILFEERGKLGFRGKKLL